MRNKFPVPRMIKKNLSLALACVFLLALVIWIISHSDSHSPKPSETADPRLVAENEPGKSPLSPSFISLQEPIQPSDPQPNTRWLDPIILRVLNTETTWNDSGTEKTVVNIVEADFHHPWLRIEETYTVDPQTGMERLVRYIPSSADTLLLELHPDTTNTDIEELETSSGIQIITVLRGTNILKAKIENFLSVDRVPGLIQSLLSTSSPVSIAEPDFLNRNFRRVPNDPLFDRQYGFDDRSNNVENRDIDAPEAWDIRTDASTIVVAVIDSGLNSDHLDLKNNLWSNPHELANGIDDDGNGLIDDLNGANFVTDSGDPKDDNGHGSLVAGIIGAEGDNGIGVAGVAWNVQLMGLKHTDSFGIGLYSDAIEAIQYAMAKNVDIINNSWGGSGFSQLLKNKLEEASSKGILIVTAAGNDGNLLSDVPVYPAAYSIGNQVVVGSTEYTDSRASFSNYDPQLVHLMALEESFGTWAGDEASYREESGTSFSAPYVTGAFAILKAEFPELSTAALIDRLLNAVENKDSLNTVCLSKGRLNLNRALLGISNSPANDAFSDALEIETEGSSISDSLTFATLEAGEPMSVGTMDPHQTVWYQWQAPRSTRAIFELNTLNFQGLMAIYQGTDLNQLNLIESAQSTSADRPSVIELDVGKDELFFIQIGRTQGDSGYFTLTLALAPDNDHMDAATELSGETFDINGSLFFATREADEPQIHPAAAGTTIWYQWQAPKSGPFLLDIRSSRGQLFYRVFKGTPLNNEAVEPQNSLPQTTSLFEVVQGQLYYLGIDAQSDKGGTFVLEGVYLEAPEITIEPSDIASTAGGEALFNVGVLSLAEPLYQWFHENEPIPGANKSFLYLTNLQTADTGSYYVNIQVGDFQLQSRSALLTLEDSAFQILRKPESTVLLGGSTLNLRTYVVPSGSATFAWYKDRQLIENATSASLQIPDVQLQDSGLYEVEVFFEGRAVDRFEAPVRVVEGDSMVSGIAWQNTGFGNPQLGRVRRAGNHVFALAEQERLGFSANGSSWQYTSIGNSGRLNWIAFGANRYVIAAEQGIFTSTDLYTWQEVNVDASGVQQVAYGNGIFVATGSNNVYHSTDGTSWSALPPPSGTSLSAVTWADDKFIMLDIGNTVYSSSDGTVWESIGTSNLQFPYEILYDEGIFWGTRNDLEISFDGISWSKTGIPGGWLGGFAIDPDTKTKYVLTESAFWEKTDSWKKVQDTEEIGSVVGLAVLNQEAILTVDGFPQLLSEYNPELRPKERLHELGFVNGKFLARSAGENYESTDGSVWAKVNTNQPALIGRRVAYGNGIYVFRSAWGASLNSLSQNIKNFNLIAFGNGRFVALSGLQLLSSEDGQNWTEVGTVEASISKDLIFAEGKFLYMDQTTIRTSTNGLSWEVSNVVSPRFESIIHGGGTFVRSSNQATVWTSADGISWQSATLSYGGGSPNVSDVAYFNGHFYALAGGVIFESEGGADWTAINFEAQGYSATELETGNNRLVMLTDAGPVTWRTGNQETPEPILIVSGPPSGTSLAIGERVTFNINSFSETGAITKVDILKDDSLIGTLTPPLGSFSYQVEGIGDAVLTFVATDSNGQTAQEVITITGMRNLYARVPENGPMMWDIAYFKGAFYGAGPGGIIFQSLDGETWKQIQTQSPNDLTSFYHNDIGICAIGPPDILLFSKDGIHWQRIPVTNVSPFRGQFTSSFLVIPTNSDRAWISPNGSEWYSLLTGQKIAGSSELSAPNLPLEYVDLGELYLGSPGRPAIQSPQPNPGGISRLGSIVVGAEERKGVFRTTDGLTWQDTTPAGLDRDDIAGTEALGGTFFLFTHDRPKKRLNYISQDGLTWTPVNGPEFISNLVFKNGTFWGTDRHLLWQSQNGIDWEARQIGPYEEVYSGGDIQLLSSPNGLLMSEFNEGDYFRTSFSVTGESWNAKEVRYFTSVSDIYGTAGNLHAGAYSFTSDFLWSIKGAGLGGETAFGNGLFLTQRSSSNELEVSADAMSWAVHEADWIADNDLDLLTHDGESSFWYVSNDGAYLTRSNDGFQWQEKTYPGFINERGRIIKFKDKLYADSYFSEDDGDSWQVSLQEEGEIWLAATKELLLAVVLTNSNALKAYLNDGSGWEETTLPSGTRPWHVQANQDLFFYAISDLVYTSFNGSTWGIGAQRLTKQMKTAVANDTFYLYGDEISIREFSQKDLSIQNLSATFGTFGVGDELGITIEILNAGQEIINTTKATTVDLLLTPFPNRWGNAPDGSHNLQTAEIQLPSLQPGKSSLLTTSITIPDSIRPGEYYLSAHITPPNNVADYNGSNNFWLGDRLAVSIPERSLDLSWVGSGLVFSEKPLVDIPFKQNIQLIPKPENGYQFSGWTGDVSAEVEIAQIMMDSNKSVSARFTPRQFNVAITVGDGGNVLGAPPNGYSNYGDNVELSAQALEKWSFLGWFGDRLSQSPTIEFVVGRDIQIIARFGQPLDSWLEEKFSPEELLDPDTGGILGDPDKNGFTNLQEFLFGLEPGSRVPPRFEIFRDGEDVCLVYPRSLTAIGEPYLEVRYSSDLSDWKTDALEERVVREEAAVEYVEVRKHNPGLEPLFFEIRAVAE